LLSDGIKLKFGCLNIQSLNATSTRAGINYVKRVLEDLKFHIFVVTETWLQDSKENNVQIVGYRHRVANRKVRKEDKTVKRGGGVAIYVRNCITFDEPERSELGSSVEYLHIKLLTPIVAF